MRPAIGHNGAVNATEHSDKVGPQTARQRPAEADAVLAAAVDAARTAAVELGGDTVGEHLGARAEGERLVRHRFAATLPGYVGWYWAVTLARAPRARTPTVDEVVLLPGTGALLAPSWLPWHERLRPGDLSPGDLLPPDPADPRLVPAYTLSDDPAVESVAFELGLGRARVMSRSGRFDAAERWYDADTGPDTAMARHAPARCGTCGFLLPLAGSLQAGFGVCGNEITSTDGRVVSVEYGCGAHSEAEVLIPALSEPSGAIYDDGNEITISDRPPLPAVLEHDQVAEHAEQPAGQAGPEPDAVVVASEPAPERQQHDEAEEPQPGADRGDAPRVDLDGGGPA